MAHVIVLDSIDKDIFVCGMCKSVFYYLEGFLSHKKLQCTPKELKNASSDSKSTETTTASLRASNTEPQQEKCAEKQRAATSSLPCSECGKMLKNMKTLKVHMKSHDFKPYQCLICGRCFNQNSHLQRHVISHKVWLESLSKTTVKSADDEILSYSCPYCKVVFSNYHIFRSHLKNHETMKKYKCIQGECIYFFETVESLLHHVSADHESPVYSCSICKRLFNSLETIATHQQSHKSFIMQNVQDRQFKCLQCDAVFKKPEKLSLHMLTENHKKMCIHCSKTFVSDKRLRLHLQTHRKIKPYECNICNSSFHMKKYLTNHMLKHGSKKFTCSVCKNMFMRRDLLQRHMKLHQGCKLFKCPYKDTLDCQRQFSRQDKLKLHIKYHIKIETLGCNNSWDNNKSYNTLSSDG